MNELVTTSPRTELTQARGPQPSHQTLRSHYPDFAKALLKDEGSEREQLFREILLRLTAVDPPRDTSRQTLIESYYKDLRTLTNFSRELDQMFPHLAAANTFQAQRRIEWTGGDSFSQQLQSKLNPRTPLSAYNFADNHKKEFVEDITSNLRCAIDERTPDLDVYVLADRERLQQFVTRDLRERARELTTLVFKMMHSAVYHRLFGIVQWAGGEPNSPHSDVAQYSFINRSIEVETDVYRTYRKHVATRWNETTVHTIIEATVSPLQQPAIRVPQRVKQIVSHIPDFMRDTCQFVSGDLVSGVLIRTVEEEVTEVEEIPSRQVVLGDPALTFANRIVITGWTEPGFRLLPALKRFMRR